ncbi:hypothetical protein FS837_008046, partial [Tulasnella sp. UAMH 9824]
MDSQLDHGQASIIRARQDLPAKIGFPKARHNRLRRGSDWDKVTGNNWESQWAQIQDALHALESPILNELEVKCWYDDSLFVQNGIRTLSLPTRVPGLKSLVLREVVPAAPSPSLGNLKKLVMAWAT